MVYCRVGQRQPLQDRLIHGMKGLNPGCGARAQEASCYVSRIWEATGRKATQMEAQDVKTETFYSSLGSAAMSNGERKVGKLRLDSDNAVPCMSHEASGLFHRVETKFIASGNCNSIGGREVWRQPHQWSFKRKGLSRGEGGWSVL